MTNRTANSAKPSALPEELLGVARAMSLLWSFRPRTAIFNLARLLGERRGDGRALTQEDVKSAIKLLDERGALVGMPHRDGYYRLADDLRAPLYRELLETRRTEHLREALFQHDGYRPERGQHYYWPIHDRAAAVGILRLALFSGMPAAEVKTMISAMGRSLDAGGILQEAGFEAFDGAIVERVVPELRCDRTRIEPSSARAEGVQCLLSWRSAQAWDGWLSYAWSRAVDTIRCSSDWPARRI